MLILHAAAAGIAQACAWPVCAYLVAGIGIGAVVGLLPGLGGPAMLALLLPVIWPLAPLSAAALLMGAVAVTATTGDITSILLGVPGEAISAAMVVDGHALARRGEAGRALGAALVSSLMGAIFGAVILALAIPIARPLMLSFGSPELFMLAMAGIALMAPLVQGAVLKGLTAGGLGLFLATIGVDPIHGTPRYTFGSPFLWDGLGLLPLALGLFAIPEAIALIASGQGRARAARDRISGLREGLRDARRHWRLVLRCSAIGSCIGVLPGLGASVAQWIAYAHATAGADREDRAAGTILGVLGPGAASNATLGGALVPTIVFGIPGGLLSALLLTAFTMKGLVPGDAMLLPEANGGHLSLVFSLVCFLVLANVLVVSTFVWLVGPLSRLAEVRGTLLFPSIVLLTCLGAFVERHAMMDLLVVSAAGALGIVMARADWPRPPLLLGFVLGPIAENRLFLSTNLYGWTWWHRPGVLIIAALGIAMFAHARLRKRRSGAARQDMAALAPATGVDAQTFRIDTVLSAIALIGSIAGLVGSAEFGREAAVFPRVTLTILGGLAVLQLVSGRRAAGPPVSSPWPRAALGWTAVFPLAVWTGGFLMGGPIAALAYLHWGAREGWLTCCAQAAGIIAALVLLRDILHVPIG